MGTVDVISMVGDEPVFVATDLEVVSIADTTQTGLSGVGPYHVVVVARNKRWRLPEPSPMGHWRFSGPPGGCSRKGRRVSPDPNWLSPSPGPGRTAFTDGSIMVEVVRTRSDGPRTGGG